MNALACREAAFFVLAFNCLGTATLEQDLLLATKILDEFCRINLHTN